MEEVDADVIGLVPVSSQHPNAAVVGLSWEFHLSMGSFLHENLSYSHPGLGGRCVSPGRFECQVAPLEACKKKKKLKEVEKSEG